MLRTLPKDLSELGKFVCHCWFDIGGGTNEKKKKNVNGIGRLIMQFYGGFDSSGGNNPHALIGMPREGKEAEVVKRCSNCIQVMGKKILRCCGNVTYCSKECQKKDWKSRHKGSCSRSK